MVNILYSAVNHKLIVQLSVMSSSSLMQHYCDIYKLIEIPLHFFVAGSQQVSAVVAFTLAIFSELVQQVIHHIQDSVFNVSLPAYGTPPFTPIPTSLPSPATTKPPDDLFVSINTLSNSSSDSNFLSVDSHVDSSKITGNVNSDHCSSDKSCNNQDTVAVANGCGSQAENAQESKTAEKKKKHKSLSKLRRRRRRRRRRKDSSEESDLSDGKI